MGALFLFISFILGDVSNANGNTASFRTLIPRQGLIRLRSESLEDDFRKKIPFRVIDHAGPLLLIRARYALSKEDFNTLRKLPMVEAAEQDFLFLAAVEVTEISSPAQCALSDHCPSTGAPQSLAYERAGADLMALISPAPEGLPRIAILETGFDSKRFQSRIGSSHFELKKGYAEAGDPALDESGHGTLIAGIIGGRPPEGLASNAAITLYRVTPTDAPAETSRAILKLAAFRACQEGHSIVNVSFRETQGALDNDTDFISRLALMGCLLVSASTSRAPNPDDALVTVGVAPPIQHAADLASAISDIRLPEAPLAVWSSSPNLSACDENSQLSSGRSISTAIVSAIAAQVWALASKREGFKELSGTDQIAHITQILRASHRGGALSAPRALILARSWAENSEPEMICETESSPCSSQTECKTTRECFQSSRLKGALCQSVPIAHAQALIDLARKNGESELVLEVLRTLSVTASDEVLAPHAQAIAESLHEHWSQGSMRDPGLNLQTMTEPSTLLDLLPLLFKFNNAGNSALSAILSSSRFEAILLKGEPDSTTLLEALATGLEPASTRGPLPEAIATWVRGSSRDNAEKAVAAARLLDSLGRNTLFAAWHEHLLALETTLHRQLSLSKTLNFVTATGAEIEESLKALEPMVERNRESAKASTLSAVENPALKPLSAVDAYYFLKHPEKFEPALPSTLAFAVARQLTTDKVFGPADLNELLLSTAVRVLENRPAHAQTTSQKVINLQVQDLIESANSLEFFRAFFRVAETIDLDPSGKSENFFNAERTRLAAIRSAWLLIEQTRSEAEAQALARAEVAQALMPHLISMTPAEAGASREITIILASGSKKIDHQSIHEALDKLLAVLIEDFREAHALPAMPGVNQARRITGQAPIDSFIENPSAMKLVETGSQWPEALLGILTDAEKYPERFDKDFISRLKALSPARYHSLTGRIKKWLSEEKE